MKPFDTDRKIRDELYLALVKITGGLAEFDSNPRIYGEEVKAARAAIAKARGQ